MIHYLADQKISTGFSFGKAKGPSTVNQDSVTLEVAVYLNFTFESFCIYVVAIVDSLVTHPRTGRATRAALFLKIIWLRSRGLPPSFTVSVEVNETRNKRRPGFSTNDACCRKFR